MALPDGVRDILPLTPVQTGMLFHVLEAPVAQGRYVAVLSCSITGPLDPTRFRAAMQSAVTARDAYLAGFVWKGVKQPVQVIHDAVELPWIEHDWRKKASSDAALSQLILAEQTRVFDLKKPPLMAVTLVRLGDDRWHLIWTIHHLISDGWSTAAVLRDVFALYKDPACVAEKTASFKDYISWQKKEAPPTDAQFWATHLEGIEGASVLPRRVDAAQGQPHVHKTRALGADLSNELEAFARSLRITPHTVLSGVWALTLRRLLQENDVIFGQTTSGRPVQIPGIAMAAGAFINTLPIRSKIDPEATAEAFLIGHAQVRQSLAPHEFATLAEVQKLAPIPNGAALFDTVFVNEGVQQERFEFDELQLSDLRTLQSSNYAATMLVTPNGDFRTELYVDPAHLSAHAAEQCLQDFEQLLRRVVHDPQTRIRDLAWAGVAPIKVPQSPRYDPILTRFLEHVSTSPDALAISDGSTTFTYAELSQRARQYAQCLRDAGVAVDDIVPVALPRSADAVAAFLGVMMVGAAYVPIDVAYPSARIAQIIATVAPKHIIASSETADIFALLNAEILLSTSLSNALETKDIQKGSLAYVIFTSGSQGMPKGVQITQDALAISTGVRDTVYQETPDAFLLFSSLAFDSSVVGLYWTLATGGHLVIAETQAEQHLNKLADLMRERKITHTLCLPSLAQSLIAALPAQDLQNLRMIIAAGEAVPNALIKSCQTTLPNCRLINEYGPTETTVWCSAFDATHFDSAQPVPIGKALPGTWLGIIDIDDHPVAVGDVGEIVVAGPTLARGYLNDPQQTQDRFSALGLNGPRFYRTGDLGRSDEAGNISFLGRKDTQVKIRGFRVELSEIEAAALAVTKGCEVTAIAQQKASSARITLFVEAAETTALSTEIEHHLATALPAPFQPSRIAFCETFPRLPNGKIDKSALQEMSLNAAASDTHAPPRTDLERSIAAIYEEILDQTSLPRTAHFFELGGDSLKTLAAFVKAQDVGLPLQPIDIFDHPTVQGLAAHLRAVTDRADTQEDNGVVQCANSEGTGTPVFFVHGSLKLFNQVAKGAGRNIPVLLQFKRPLDETAAPFGQTIEEMAAASIALLKKRYPNGPYTLVGFSIGCAITMEIAKQLGPETVKTLVLLDPPYDMIGTNPELQDIWSRTKKRWHIIIRRWLRVRRFKPRIAQAKAQFQLHPKDVKLRDDNFDLAFIDALARYFIPKYTGKTVIYYTDVNTSLSPGDVMDAHFPNKTLIHLNVSHDGLIDDPEGILPISETIIAHSRSSDP